ncbi:permease [Erythrobacter rubeus]|uniref:Permease n=1 Tax=Erythrobacter rubeus TaxID=2760803 RepID=A0ABR8KKC9_9SPHN|nr:permease [Erythrobacter rubeus]MBD2840714.1 permease [Erythrobacter rubeus]
MSQHSTSQTDIDAYASYVAKQSPDERLAERGGWILGIAFTLYSALVTYLAAIGFFASIDVRFFAATVVATMAALTISYFTVPSIRAFVERLGPYGLATFHIWRIGAALGFLYYGSQGWLPDIFVSLAGWGDMLAGVLAAIVIILPRSPRLVAGMHIIGFADFIVAVGTGLTLQLLAVPAMANIALLPIALIPLVGVPLSGASHIAAFHLIWKQRQGQ